MCEIDLASPIKRLIRPAIALACPIPACIINRLPLTLSAIGIDVPGLQVTVCYLLGCCKFIGSVSLSCEVDLRERHHAYICLLVISKRAPGKCELHLPLYLMSPDFNLQPPGRSFRYSAHRLRHAKRGAREGVYTMLQF